MSSSNSIDEDHHDASKVGTAEGGDRGLTLALSGGVGGAKLAIGLDALLPPRDLIVVCNTGDDFRHLGLHIAPDLDSVMYALAAVNDETRGWGRADESWSFLETLKELSPTDDWFQLGDRDLATHLLRSHWLARGETLSTATALLCSAFGVSTRVVPMTDHPVATRIGTEHGELDFQSYFVKERCAPEVRSIRFQGAETASPAPAFCSALAHPRLERIVFCPSNPLVSIDPILGLPSVLQQIQAARRPGVEVTAVSPIIGGRALKGPAGKMMQELGLQCSALGVARYYADRGLIDSFVIDQVDQDVRSEIEQLGVEVVVSNTIMLTREDSRRLAATVLR